MALKHAWTMAAALLGLPLAGQGHIESPHALPRLFQAPLSDLQHQVRSRFETAWPGHTGELIYLTYDNPKTFEQEPKEFSDQVWQEFQRTTLAQQIRPDLSSRDWRRVELSIRSGAIDAYKEEFDSEIRGKAHGNHSLYNISFTTAKGGPYTYPLRLLVVENNCQSCTSSVAPDPTAACLSMHPDQVMSEQLKRHDVVYHELGHLVAEMLQSKGHAFNTYNERNIEEVRASLFGMAATLQQTGPVYSFMVQLRSDEAAEKFKGHRYFNPPAYGALKEWVETTPAPSYAVLGLRDLFNKADQLAQQHALGETAAKALADYANAGSPDSEALQDRISHYGIRPQYSRIEYQFDQARLRNLKDVAYSALLKGNPLRPAALRENEANKVDPKNPQQVAAYDAFNEQQFGPRSCRSQTATLKPAAGG